MKSHLTLLTLLGTWVLMLRTGCAHNEHLIVDRSTVNATVNVSPSISLGDDVAKSASQAAIRILNPATGPTEALREKAIQEGLHAGLATANKKSIPVNSQQIEELRNALDSAVEQYLNSHSRHSE